MLNFRVAKNKFYSILYDQNLAADTHLIKSAHNKTAQLLWLLMNLQHSHVNSRSINTRLNGVT